MSAAALDPSDPSYRNYFTKIQAELSPQKSPAVSLKILDERFISNEACKMMLNRHPQSSNKMQVFLPPSFFIPHFFPASLLSSITPSHQLPSPFCLPFLSPSHFFQTTPPPPLHLCPLQELVSIRRREQLVREAIVGKSPGVYSQLFKRFHNKSRTLHCTQMLNFKWALSFGPNWFNRCTCPNCILMVCFGLLFDLEGEVAGAQII